MTIDIEAEISPSRSMAARSVFAAAWMVGGKLVSRSIDLVTLLILARLLTPADFGLVAMAMTVLFVVEAVLELPLAQVLVRVRSPTTAMFETAFTLGICRAAAIACLMAAASWPMALFYGEPRLVALICVLALAPILRGLVSPRMIVFMQSLDFRREITLEVVAKATNIVVAVPIAYATQSYWALAVGTVTTPFVSTLLSYVFAPMRLRLTLSEWPRFRQTVGWATLSQLISAVNWQLDRILIGRIADITSFGRYAMANTLSDLARQALLDPLMRPLMAVFAAPSSEAPLRIAYARATAAIVMLAAPLFLSLGLLSEPVIRIVVGEKWLEAAPLLRWIAIAQLLTLPFAALYPVAMALDQARVLTVRLVAELAVSAPTVFLLATLYGIPGAIAARFIVLGLCAFVSAGLIRKLVDLSVREQAANVWRPYAALIAMGFVMHEVGTFVPPASGLPTALLHLAAALAAGWAAYLAALWLLWRLEGQPEGMESLILGKASQMLRNRRAG